MRPGTPRIPWAPGAFRQSKLIPCLAVVWLAATRLDASTARERVRRRPSATSTPTCLTTNLQVQNVTAEKRNVTPRPDVRVSTQEERARRSWHRLQPPALRGHGQR